MSQMNIGGGIWTEKIAKGQVVTVKIDCITFYKLVKVEHMVCCYGKCTKIDNSSVVLKLEVWVKPLLYEKAAEHYWLTQAAFTYLAIDQDGKSRNIEKCLNLENV